MSDEATANVADREARADHAQHLAVCTERYGNIDHKLNELKAQVLAMGITNHERFNALSNRMWAFTGSMLGLCVIGIAGLVVLIITRGLK